VSEQARSDTGSEGRAPLATLADPQRSASGTERHALQLPATLSTALKALCSREGPPFLVTLVAALDALLYRYASQDVIGVRLGTGARPGTEGIHLLRTRPSAEPTFRDLALCVHEALLEKGEQESWLVDPPAELGFEFAIPNIVSSTTNNLTAAASGDSEPGLSLRLWDTPSGLVGSVECRLMDLGAVGRLLSHLEGLVQGMLAGPDRRVVDLPLLSESEEQQLLVSWNDTAQEYPSEQCAHELFEEQARRTPDAVALTFEGGELTFSALNGRANQLAHRLRGLGVRPEIPVGLCMRRSPGMVVGLLGILKAGGAYVPLDPAYPRERLAFMTEDARIGLLVTEQSLLGLVPASGSTRALCLDTEWESIRGESDGEVVGSGVRPQNLSYVIYTSGSTGKPKGVMIPHQGLVNYLSWATKTYMGAEGAGAPVHSSIAFDLTVTSLFCPLLVGRAVALLPEGDLEALGVGLRRNTNGFSLVKITPAHLEILAQQLTGGEASGATRALVIGGESLRKDQLLFWQAHAPGTRLINEYGPTETVVGCCVYELSGDSVPAVVPIGRPIANTRLYLLDPNLNPVPVGIPGELYVGGPGVARGYWNRPDLTAAKFTPDPFGAAPGGRLYRTGDLASYAADGVISFLGRIDQQVKIRGFRIELQEIEGALLRNPAIKAAVVTAREGGPKGKELVAYLSCNSGPQPTVTELRASLRTVLPAHMVPSSFIILDSFPFTANGKVDRQALGRIGQRSETVPADVRPRTQIEASIAQVWQKALGVGAISIHDNFFDLGGDSLLLMRVISQMEQTIGTRVDPGEVIFQTLEQLAATCDRRLRGDGEPIRLGRKIFDAVKGAVFFER
jgi:amino acid adenylation domain-containing protein